MKTGSLSVLCIDDDDLHVELLQHAAESDPSGFKVHAPPKGVEVVGWLRESEVRPDFILLDGRMPGRDGLCILKELKADAELRRIPVLMLTGIAEPRHIRDAYSAGANLYFVKPMRAAEYAGLVALFVRLWGSAELPGGKAANVVG